MHAFLCMFLPMRMHVCFGACVHPCAHLRACMCSRVVMCVSLYLCLDVGQLPDILYPDACVRT